MLRKTISTLLALACAVTTFAFTSFSASAASVEIRHDAFDDAFSTTAKYNSNSDWRKVNISDTKAPIYDTTGVFVGSDKKESTNEFYFIYDLTNEGNVGNRVTTKYEYTDTNKGIRNKLVERGTNPIQYAYSHSPHGPWTSVTPVETAQLDETNWDVHQYTSVADLPADARYVKVIYTNIYALNIDANGNSPATGTRLKNEYTYLTDILITKEDAEETLVEYDFNTQTDIAISDSMRNLDSSDADDRLDGWTGKNVYMSKSSGNTVLDTDGIMTFTLSDTNKVKKDFSIWYEVYEELISADKSVYYKPIVKWSSDNSSWYELDAIYALSSTVNYKSVDVAVANAKVENIPDAANYIQVTFPALNTFKSTNSSTITSDMSYWLYSVRAVNYKEVPEPTETDSNVYNVGDYGTLTLTGKQYENSAVFVPGENITATFTRGSEHKGMRNKASALSRFLLYSYGYDTYKMEVTPNNSDTVTIDSFAAVDGEIKNIAMVHYGYVPTSNTLGLTVSADQYNFDFMVDEQTTPVNLTVSTDKTLSIAIYDNDGSEVVNYLRVPVTANKIVLTGKDLSNITVTSSMDDGTAAEGTNYAKSVSTEGNTHTITIELESDKNYAVKAGNRVITQFLTEYEDLGVDGVTNNLGTLRSDGKTSAYTFIDNHTGKDYSFNMITAIYDSQNRLVGANVTPCTGTSENYRKYFEAGMTIPEGITPAQTYKTKIFIWDSNITPLGDAIVSK